MPASATAFPVTKFDAGRRDAWTLERQRALAATGELGGVSAVVACAPAGYGKSTFLGQLTADPARACVWLSLDEDDDDPRALWSAIIAGFRSAAPTMFGDLAGAETSNVREGMIVPLIEGLAASAEPRIVVLDDLHRLGREDTLASLDWFLRHLPPRLTIAIGSRTAVGLPALDRLRAHGAVVDLTVADLRFSDDEAATVLERRYGLALEPADVEQIQSLTAGWPAAVSLVGASLRRGIPLEQIAAVESGSSTVLAALVSEALAGSASGAVELLLDVSVLEVFNEPLVNTVIRSDEAWPMLTGDIARTGLLVSLDDGGIWWRMHHLVREVLHDQLGRTAPERRRLLHARAARAFESDRDVSSAVRHLLGAEDYQGVAEVLANVRRNFAVPRQAVGLAWLDRIPENVRAADPRLCFWEAWAMATSGDRDRRDRALVRGRAAAGTAAIVGFPDWDAVEDFVIASACYDDVGGSLAAADRFLARSIDTAGPHAALVRAGRGALLHLAGRDRDAVEALGALREELAAALPRPLALLVPTYQALACLELGERDRAAAHVAEADRARVIHDLGPDLVYLVSAQPAARLHTEDGDPETGLSIARQALEQGLAHGDGMLVVPGLLAEVARAHLALGRPGQASVAVAQAHSLIAGSPGPGALPARLDRLVAGSGSRSASVALSHRELEVLTLLPSSLTAPEIAAELFVSVNTARSHIKSIYRKLGVGSRERAVEQASRLGLLREG